MLSPELLGNALHGFADDFDWRDIAGARDVLIHEYFRVDLTMAWDMIHKDLPHLEREVRLILGELGSAEGAV